MSGARCVVAYLARHSIVCLHLGCAGSAASHALRSNCCVRWVAFPACARIAFP